MNNLTSGIYKICNLVNGKIYVGQTVNLHHRKDQHISALKTVKHSNPHLQSAWNKYGDSMFEFSILEVCHFAQLNERENFWIEFLESWKSDRGYNLDRLAQGTGPRSPETKALISKKLMGHPHSEEARRKISASKLGHKYGPCSEEKKINISRSKKGKKFSEEHKKKLSEAKIGKPGNRTGGLVSDETRAKMRAAKIGKPSLRRGTKHTEETKAKMRAAKAKHAQSEE